MSLQVNDRVKELNDIGVGKVVKVINDREVVVQLDTGFKQIYLQKDLVKVISPNQEANLYGLNEEVINLELVNDLKLKLREKNKSAFIDRTQKKQRQRGIDMEIDLHIENILDSHHGMSNGEIVMVQLNIFEKSLKRAMSKRFKKVVFIHGVGQGVLRAEIRRILADCYPNTEFYDADYLKYGVGGTEVIIRYNYK